MGIPKIILDKMGKLSKIYTPFGENGIPILSSGSCNNQITFEGCYLIWDRYRTEQSVPFFANHLVRLALRRER